MTFYKLLYVSDLAAATSIGEVAFIAGAARLRNARRDITGLLLFDGAHFGQVLEGPKVQLDELLEQLRRDSRHTAMDVLFYGPAQESRRFSDWRLGFIDIPVRGGIDGLRGLSGTDAMQAFMHLLPPLSADLGEALPHVLQGE